MSAKCNCFNCSRHLEFDPNDAGSTITCPACGLETRLYIPDVSGPMPRVRVQNAPSDSASLSSTLASVRRGSSYRALRDFIETICIILRVVTGLFCFSVLANVALWIMVASPKQPTWYHILSATIGLSLLLGTPYLVLCYLLDDVGSKASRAAKSIASVGQVLVVLPYVAFLVFRKYPGINNLLAQWYLIVLAIAGAVLIYLVFEFLLRAAQQAVLLLIDMADCSLRLTAAAEAQMASRDPSRKGVGI